MKKTLIYSIFIITVIIQMVFYFVHNAGTPSTYDKYESGEYYFRAHAVTTANTDPSLATNINLDPSDPKTILLLSSGQKVIAYDPQGLYCTVEYDDHVIKDFPVSRLEFKTQADKDVFNGKKYTKEEYDARIAEIAVDPSQQDVLSSKRMIPDTSDHTYIIALIIGTIFMSGLFFIGREHELFSTLILIVWIVLCVVYNVILIRL